MNKETATGSGKSGVVETDAMRFKRLDAIVQKGMPQARKMRHALLEIKKLSPERYETHVTTLKASMKAAFEAESKKPVTDEDVEEIFNAMFFPEKLK